MFVQVKTALVYVFCTVVVNSLVLVKNDESEYSIQLISTIIEKKFGKSYCIHIINDNSMTNLINKIIEKYPVYNVGNKRTKCLNYVIAIKDIKITRDLFRNTGILPHDGKYLIISCDNNTQILRQTVEQELFLDVVALKVTDKGDNIVQEQLGVVIGKHGRVDLRRRQLSVAAFHNPPFAVHNLDTNRLDGIEVRVVRELAEALNFSWKIHEPKDGQLWGQQNKTGHWSGLKGELCNGDTDIGIAMLYLSEEHYLSFQLSHPYTMVCLTFLVPAPRKLLGHWDALLRPLHLSTWFTFISIAGVHTVLLYIISRKSMNSCIVETIRVAALVSGPQPSGPISQRVLFTTWIVGCFFVTNFYGSELSAWLVAQASESPLKTFEDLADSKVVWGRKDSDLALRLQNSSNPILRNVAEKFQFEYSDEEMEKNVLHGDYGVFVHVLSDGYPAGAEFLSTRARARLIAMQECIVSEYVAVGMRRGLPLVRAASFTLRRLQEAGLLQEWQARDVRTYGDGANYKDDAPADEELLPLSLSNLAGAFALCILGHVLAAVAFVGELAVARRLLRDTRNTQHDRD